MRSPQYIRSRIIYTRCHIQSDGNKPCIHVLLIVGLIFCRHCEIAIIFRGNRVRRNNLQSRKQKRLQLLFKLVGLRIVS